MFKRILIGCGTFVGVIVLAVLFFVGYFSYQVATPEKVIQEFHKFLAEGDFDRAYACLSADVQSNLSKHEFITKMSSVLPFQIAEHHREEIFKIFFRLLEVEIIKSNLLDDRANVEIKIAFPAERAIEELVRGDARLRSMKEEIDRLGSEFFPDEALIYNKAGVLMLAVLDSMQNQQGEKLFQYYDVKKTTVYLEFESGGWKIKETI